ncbi:DNA helicase II [Gammaproteobacteria bacterium]|nr:DNA helicase II [Gammaproteobacteria bacterium]
MMNNNLHIDLNNAQKEAVMAPLCNQLVLAGAGSGKTRVLVHRIARLIDYEGLQPCNILAVTFTNKASNEMRSRIEQVLDVSAKDMWVGTFHGIAHRLLRMHWRDAGLSEGFQILDSDDQVKLLRRVIKSLSLDEDKWPAKKAQWFVCAKKDDGLEPHNIPDYNNANAKTMIQIYTAYQEACVRSGSVDFSDLLLKVHKLWINHPDILANYQKRFRYILVDEFQDTNAIQYALIRLIASKDNNVMIVGDDDQSIYGWRGAKIENIHKFCEDFPDTLTIRLEQNYRSTGVILKAANALISNNSDRLGKNLWTSESDGEKITVYAGFNDLDEARYIVNRIQDMRMNGHSLNEMAILYRSNAQSRILEEALMQSGIVYKVYGGLRFFDRAEIKDALAYLRLISNRNDDAAFERVVNTPTRGIGERTRAQFRDRALKNNTSLWSACLSLLETNELSSRAATSLDNFLQLIDSLSKDTDQLSLYEQIEHVIHNSGLIDHFKKDKSEKSLARLENLEELVNAAKQFETERLENDMPLLVEFLTYSTLEAGDIKTDGSEVGVQLMTLHSAKGLEFPVVFMSGFEEGLFPHYMTKDDPRGLEEERRLCYVGMTRAMKRLFITYAEIRRLHGKETYHRASRFLKEIPKDYLLDNRTKTKVSTYKESNYYAKSTKISDNDGALRIGQKVNHHKFGEGTVLQYEGRGEHARIQVRFQNESTKWLIASFVEV